MKTQQAKWMEEILEVFDNIDYSSIYYIAKRKRDWLKSMRAVIVYGNSDDLIEFDGSTYDEISAWMGGEILLDDCYEIIKNLCDCDCPYFKKYISEIKHKKITGRYGNGNGSWKIDANFTHSKFSLVEQYENEEPIIHTGIIFLRGN